MRIGSDRLTVERVVGSGGMGTVFRACDRETGRPVAMKIMRNSRDVARFERESELLALLAHPSIVEYIGHGTTVHGERFLAMEWLDGETLHARLLRSGLSLSETMTLGLRIAEGLAAAHGAGVVHRDLKPTNLMLVNNRVEETKIVDFGVAYQSSDRNPLTMTGDLVGTPAYMAPEQARAARRVGPAADIFALGCILHECASGRSPAPVVLRGRCPTFPTLSSPSGLEVRRPEVPRAIVDVIDHMLVREPALRIPDGAAALAELRRVSSLDVTGIGAPLRFGAAETPTAQGPQAVTLSAPGIGFGELQRENSEPRGMSPLVAEVIAILGAHVPLPMAVLRLQCDRLGKDPHGLTPADLIELVPLLADTAARFASVNRAVVLAALHALLDKAG